MKKTKWIMPILALSIALASCTGDDGEPGPQGDPGATGAAGATGATGAAGEGFQKIGSFSGTVAGKRTDGTAFSEAFKLEYGSNIQGFTDLNGNKVIDFYRYDKPYYYSSQFEVSNLVLSGNNLVATFGTTTSRFSFSKELNVTDIFNVEAIPYLKDLPSYVLELSEAQNQNYNFEHDSDGTLSYNNNGYTDPTTSQYTEAYSFSVYSTGSYSPYYRKDNGSLGIVYDYSTGNYITSGAIFNLYNKLVFKNDAVKNALTFFDKATNTSLGVSIPAVPADTFTVTNYAQDAATGVVTFDFAIKISQYRSRTGYTSTGKNTTGNDLTITGSFNSGGKVYKNIVSRTASGG